VKARLQDEQALRLGVISVILAGGALFADITVNETNQCAMAKSAREGGRLR